MTDLLFTGGRVLGVDRPEASVAVSDDRIVAVGGPEVADALSGTPNVVDLAGGLLVPGFTDAHAHPIQGGLERGACDLAELTGSAAYLDRIASYAAAHPDGWITGGGWAMSAFPGGTPTAAALDAVVGDRPVFLVNRDHHGAWVSSRTLTMAGIDADTPDPVSGRIERDPAGHPTGTLHEGAMDLVERIVPEHTPEQMRAGLLEGQAYLHSLGITGWQDAIVGAYAGMLDNAETYRAADAAGLLTARVVGALWWRRGCTVAGVPDQVAKLVETRSRLLGDRFRATSVKIMADGVAENFTAAVSTPYLDRCGHPTDNDGISFVPREVLLAAVPALDAAGFQVHVHAIGDRAVHDALDAFELARRHNGPNDNRHHIAHLQLVRPEDVPRFGALDVAANLQPLWAVHETQMDELTIPFIGAERSGWQYPFAGLAAAGARLVAGSDWPVSSPNPLWGMHVAVNRTPPRAERDVEVPAFLPEQRLGLGQALAAYTAGSAWVNHRDDAGRIEPGALADFALLDRDLRVVPAEEIAEVRVLGTWVGGRRV